MCVATRVQSESEQRPHKLSYHLSAKGAEGEAVVKQLEEKLAAAGVSAKARLVFVVTYVYASATCHMSAVDLKYHPSTSVIHPQ